MAASGSARPQTRCLPPGKVGAAFGATAAFARLRKPGSTSAVAADPLLALQPAAVSIHTDPDTHAAFAVGAFAAGCHVFPEKPIAVTSSDAERVVQAAADANRKLVATALAVPSVVRYRISMDRTNPPAGDPLDLLAQAAGLAPLVTAVCHPCDQLSLAAAVAAHEAGLIEPLLIGPEGKIRQAAADGDIDLAGLTLVDVPHSHAAAERAVALARQAEAAAIMKGSLHTDELMAAVIARDGGLRTDRRISHVFVMRVNRYPRLLLITDAAVNIEPTLEEKVDIVQNAIDLAQALGVPNPKVAILSAVETVTSKMRSTIDAAALCKMADRGQITGGILDGPLAFDNAVSLFAADVKGIHSPVAGQADILVVPDIESGNMLAKQLEYFAEADSAGIVLGARVPIVLTSRADPVEARVRSCAVASLLAQAKGAAA